MGTGFSDRQLGNLYATLKPLEQQRPPFADADLPSNGVHWVQPRVVVDIAFTERTRDGRLRHPSFRGVREDRDPQEARLPRAD